MASITNLLVAGLLLVGAPQSNAAVCLGVNNSLGYFPTGYPWYIPLLRPMPPPQTPEAIDTQFYLFTNALNTTAFKIVKQPMNLTGSTFNETNPTYFIIQGFMANINIAWVNTLKDALLMEFNANVFVVDWSKGARMVNYLQAASNTRIAGAEISRLIAYMVANSSANVTKMHLIGYSLGAQVAGYVGKAIQGIGRISALDATQPGFEGFPAEVRLTSNDSMFVEAIHTNARPLIPLMGLGYFAPLGHVDFYVNGGALQPGCFDGLGLPLSILSMLPMTLLQFGMMTTEALTKSPMVCSHSRSIDLFIASVTNKTNIMWGHRVTNPLLPMILPLPACTTNTSCSPLGLQTINYPARGVFAVKTTGSSPYYISEPASDTIMAPFQVEASATL